MDDKKKEICNIDDKDCCGDTNEKEIDCNCNENELGECECEHDDSECCCGHEHDEDYDDEYDEDDEFASVLVDLEDEDGNVISCEVIDSFEYNENQYIIVLNPKDDSNYMFKVIGDDDDPDFIIPDDDEFEEVSKYYDSLIEDIGDEEDIDDEDLDEEEED